MIKFFRSIRKSIISDPKTGKSVLPTGRYLKYALGEIILVVIGILIALQINTWNEDRKTRVLERTILVELKKSMESDITNQIRPNIEQLVQDIENIRTIKRLLDNELKYHDSISPKFRSLMFSKSFKWETTAYKILENNGVNIIRNPQLQESILRNYNTRYPDVKYFLENFSNNLNLFFRPMMRTHFTFEYFDNLNTRYIPLDLKALRTNHEFKNSVQTAFINFRSNLKAHREIEMEVLKTVEMIDLELKHFSP